MTTKNQRLEMSLAYLREHKIATQVPFWCGYANVIPFCYHYDNDYNTSEYHSINQKGEIYWIVDYYFDNGAIYERNSVFAYTVKEAVRKGYNFNILNSLRYGLNHE